MYTTFFRYFGLRDNPFNVNPDPQYLFLNESTQAVLDDIASAIYARKGLIVLTGDAGTGKTTLVNQLKHGLEEQGTATAFIFNPHLDVDELFDLMLAAFSIANSGNKKMSSLARINNWLLEQYQAGRNAVLFLDEAQGLPTHVLEQIRVLLNHEMPQQFLQIVLSGQPELEQKLRRPDLQQIRQRISLKCHTTPLTVEEARGYIQRRVSVAGGNGTGAEVFTPDAIETAHHYSGGIPRVMNMLCEHAMMRAYFHQAHSVSASMIDEAAVHLEFEDAKPARSWTRIEGSETEGSVYDASNVLTGAEGTLDIRPVARALAANELKTARSTWFEVTAGANLDSQVRPLRSIEPGNGHQKHEAKEASKWEMQSDSSDEMKVAPAIVQVLERGSQIGSGDQEESAKRRFTVVPGRRTTEINRSLLVAKELMHRWWREGLKFARSMPRPRRETGRSLLLAKARLRRWARECLKSASSMPITSRDFWQNELSNSAREFSSRVSAASKQHFATSKEQLTALTIEVSRVSKQQLSHSQRYLRAGWDKTFAYITSQDWDKNLESVLHWLQQPLPHVKIHRRIGH